MSTETPSEYEFDAPTEASLDAERMNEPADTGDDVSASRVWLVAGVVTVIALLAGGAMGYFIAVSTFDRGVEAAVAESASQFEASLNNALNGVAVAEQAPVQPTATPLPAVVEDINADDDPYLGAEDAPVVIVEFSDFRCPYCKRFYDDTLPLIIENYGDQIRFVYRDFPVVGGETAAVASECADEQDGYWDYHDALFTEPSAYSGVADYVELAGEQGLDTAAFETCMDSDEIREEIVNDYNDARNYGVSGTPTFFVNGTRIIGAQGYDAFAAAIDEALAAN